MSEGKKIPKIRFPGFEGEWEVRKVSDLIESYNVKVSSDCELPVLTSSKTEGIQYQSDHFGREQNHDVDGYNVLPRGFCTYRNRSDGTDFTFNINNLCDEGIISKFYPVFNTKDGNDLLFLVSLLNNEPDTIKTIAYTAKGTGQKVLSFSDLQEISITVPSGPEQKKISELYANIDVQIEQTQNELDKWKEFKKGMLQKMFPKEGESVPEIRFPGFEGEWKKTALSQLTRYQNGKGHEEGQKNNGKYELINLNSISIDGGLKESGKYVDDASDLLQKNDLVMILSDVAHGYLLGRVAIIPEDNRFVLNQRVALLRPNSIADPGFLSIYINAHQAYFKLKGAGSSQQNISRGDVENFEVALPTMNEQIKISCLFEHINTIINNLDKLLTEWEMIKKGLLQQMFVA